MPNFRKPRPEEAKAAPVLEVKVPQHQMSVEELVNRGAAPTAEKPDFRGLPEPERTLARLDFILRDKTLLPVFKIAAAVLVKSFFGVDENFQFIKMKELMPETEGFSSRARSGMLSELKERGLIEQEQVHRKGMMIRLLF